MASYAALMESQGTITLPVTTAVEEPAAKAAAQPPIAPEAAPSASASSQPNAPPTPPVPLLSSGPSNAPRRPAPVLLTKRNSSKTLLAPLAQAGIVPVKGPVKTSAPPPPKLPLRSPSMSSLQAHGFQVVQSADDD